MHTRMFVAASAVALVLAIPLSAGQDVMSEEEYGAAMTEIRFLVQDMNLHIDARYWPELGEDVQKMQAQFEMVQAFWEARSTDEAVTFAQAAIDALGPIRGAAGDRNIGGAQEAVRGLQDACAACHDQFREETADGFRIRQ